jgi:hypothetical protein
MNKRQAKKEIIDYFKNNSIEYRFLNEENTPMRLDTSDTVYLCADIPDVIGGHIETCIRFRDEHLYCQSYYCQPIVHNEEQAIRAARIVNYLNGYLDYDCNTLYEHSFVFDEDNGDIFNGCLIRYELLDEYFYETMNHILNFSVQQIADVCKAVVFYIHGKLDYFQATKVAIDHDLMGKPIPEQEEEL